MPKQYKLRCGNIDYRTFTYREELSRKGMNYNQQGAVFFSAKSYYTSYSIDERQRFRMLVWRCCRNRESYYHALFNYLVGESYLKDICSEFGVNQQQMYRYLDEIYLNFNCVRPTY